MYVYTVSLASTKSIEAAKELVDRIRNTEFKFHSSVGKRVQKIVRAPKLPAFEQIMCNFNRMHPCNDNSGTSPATDIRLKSRDLNEINHRRSECNGV